VSKAIVFACSHRRGGNSDRAAQLLAQGVTEAGGEAEVLYVRNREIMHCLACGYCDKANKVQGQRRCVLGTKDEAWELFEPFFTAPCVFFSAPIYFYHLPSRFKTWIDRGQQFWKARLDKEPWIADLPKRTAYSVLVAGQPTGEKLFEGARLSMKYFVQNFQMDLAEPLVFRGIDQRNDLRQQSEFESQVLELGKHGWTSSQ